MYIVDTGGILSTANNCVSIQNCIMHMFYHFADNTEHAFRTGASIKTV